MSEEHSIHKSSDILEQALGNDARLHKVSRAVREVEAQDEARGAVISRASFAPLHARLMERIAEDTASTVIEAAPAPAASRWPWNIPVAIKRPRISPLRRVAYGAMLASLLFTCSWGAHEMGRQRSPHELPLQPFVDDFDHTIKSSTPFEYAADETGSDAMQAVRVAREAASWLSTQAGIPIDVPPAHSPGLTLIGASHSVIDNRQVSQTHYLQSGVRIGLYQVRDAGVGLGSMDEVKIGQRTYLTTNRDQYRVVAWRSGEDVLALISPLAMREVLLVAQRLRSAGSGPAGSTPLNG